MIISFFCFEQNYSTCFASLLFGLRYSSALSESCKSFRHGHDSSSRSTKNHANVLQLDRLVILHQSLLQASFTVLLAAQLPRCEFLATRRIRSAVSDLFRKWPSWKGAASRGRYVRKKGEKEQREKTFWNIGKLQIDLLVGTIVWRTSRAFKRCFHEASPQRVVVGTSDSERWKGLQNKLLLSET